MANINKQEIGYNEVIAAGTANALMVQYKRANAAPLDITDVFTSLEYAATYAASGATSYAGQVIAVAGEDVETKVYKITSGGTLVELVDADALAEVVESAGKIASVKVNNEALEIAEDKSVNIDLSDYATEAWVTEYVVSAVTGGQVSLDGYATEAWVEQQGFITANNESVTSKASKIDVEALSGKVATLIGEDTNQSIRDIAKEEVAGIVGTAPEALDTLEEIANWINADSAGTVDLVAKVAKNEENIETLSGVSHTHTNKDVLDGITSDKVTAWDAAEANAKADAAEKYQVKGEYEAAGAASAAETAAKAYTDEKIGELSFDEAGAAAQALVDAKAYADGLASNYDASGSAAAAEAAAKAYADGLASNYDASGSAAAAEAAAKAYADGLAVNYDAAGAAADAQAAAKAYADGLDEAMDTRVKVLEAIDHNAYVAADEALKSELQGEINKKADASELENYLLKSEKYDDTAVRGLISAETEAREAAVEELEGVISSAQTAAEEYAKGLDEAMNARMVVVEEGVNGIDGKINTAINEFASKVTGDNETIDTFAEIVDYISKHGGEFGDLVKTVEGKAEQSDLETLQTTVSDNKTAIEGALANEVSARETLAGEVTKKASQSDFEALTGTVNTLSETVASNHEAALSAASAAKSEAIADAESKYQVKGEYEAAGAADDAQTAAEAYAKGLDEAMDVRVKVLEAIEHDAYVAADEALQEQIDVLSGDSHTHANKAVLDGITSDKVTAWDAAEQNAKDYADGLASNYDAAGAAASAETAAKAYTDEKVKYYTGGVATEVDEDNKFNVLVAESTESEKNWLTVKENALAVNEIGLDDAVTTKEITIEGGQWADAVKTVYTGGTVPVGTSWQSFLEAMLCVEKFAGTITTTQDFSVTCSSPAAGIVNTSTNANVSNSSVEVGTKVTLKGVSHKATTASQTITSGEFTYGYKVDGGAIVNSKTYTEELTPSKTNTSTALKETFTLFTDAEGTVISTKTGENSLDAVEMYVAEGSNKVTVSQTGDTYTASTAVTAQTLDVLSNLKNSYETHTPTASAETKTASASTTYTVTGYRNAFYGTTSSKSDSDATLIRSLNAANKSASTLTLTTNAADDHARMIIASPKTIKSVKNKTATQDITQLLLNEHKTVDIPGANNYAPISYHVYDKTWNESFGSDEWIITFN